MANFDPFYWIFEYHALTENAQEPLIEDTGAALVRQEYDIMNTFDPEKYDPKSIIPMDEIKRAFSIKMSGYLHALRQPRESLFQEVVNGEYKENCDFVGYGLDPKVMGAVHAKNSAAFSKKRRRIQDLLFNMEMKIQPSREEQEELTALLCDLTNCTSPKLDQGLWPSNKNDFANCYGFEFKHDIERVALCKLSADDENLSPLQHEAQNLIRNGTTHVYAHHFRLNVPRTVIMDHHEMIRTWQAALNELHGAYSVSNGVIHLDWPFIHLCQDAEATENRNWVNDLAFRFPKKIRSCTWATTLTKHQLEVLGGVEALCKSGAFHEVVTCDNGNAVTYLTDDAECVTREDNQRLYNALGSFAVHRKTRIRQIRDIPGFRLLNQDAKFILTDDDFAKRTFPGIEFTGFIQ